MSNVSRKGRGAGVDRLLTASLHQAIADVIPPRLEFYEYWLRPGELHVGQVGRAPLSAVVGFLRTEPDREAVMARAGEAAADWSVGSAKPPVARLARRLPLGLATRLALASVRRLLGRTSRGGRPSVRLHGSSAIIEIGGSVFCEVREPAAHPLCGYYAAAVTHVLRLHGLDAAAAPTRCQGTGDPRCVLTVSLRGRSRAAEAPR